jgi:heme A synthase
MGERMGYTITVWLAFAVFLTIVSASLPKSSDTVPVLSVYIMIQLGIGTLTVLVSAIDDVNNDK